MPRVLLLGSVGAGMLSVAAALVSAHRVAFECGVAASAAVIGYVLVAGRAAPPRARWALAAGLGLLGGVTAVRLSGYGEPEGDFGWFGYEPLNGATSQLHALSRRAIDRESALGVGLLLGVLCLAAAVVALPVRRRPAVTLLTVTLSLILLAVVGIRLSTGTGPGSVLGLLAATGPALLGTLAAVAIAALSGRRSDRAGLLPIGALLTAMAAVAAYDQAITTWSLWSSLSPVREGDSVFAVASVSAYGWPPVSAAFMPVVALAGPAMLAVGAVHAWTREAT